MTPHEGHDVFGLLSKMKAPGRDVLLAVHRTPGQVLPALTHFVMLRQTLNDPQRRMLRKARNNKLVGCACVFSGCLSHRIGGQLINILDDLDDVISHNRL